MAPYRAVFREIYLVRIKIRDRLNVLSDRGGPFPDTPRDTEYSPRASLLIFRLRYVIYGARSRTRVSNI